MCFNSRHSSIITLTWQWGIFESLYNIQYLSNVNNISTQHTSLSTYQYFDTYCCFYILCNLITFAGRNMKTSVARLAKGFGQLATVRGTTRYHISPFEQRAFAGMISKGIPNTIWRIRSSILDVAPRKFKHSRVLSWSI